MRGHPHLAFACFAAAVLLIAVPLLVALTIPTSDLVRIAAFVLMVQSPCVVLAVMAIHAAIELGTSR